MIEVTPNLLRQALRTFKNHLVPEPSTEDYIQSLPIDVTLKARKMNLDGQCATIKSWSMTYIADPRIRGSPYYDLYGIYPACRNKLPGGCPDICRGKTDRPPYLPSHYDFTSERKTPPQEFGRVFNITPSDHCSYPRAAYRAFIDNYGCHMCN